MPREAPVTRAIREARGWVSGCGPRLGLARFYRCRGRGQARRLYSPSFRRGAAGLDPSGAPLRTDNLDVLGTNDKFEIPGSRPAGSPRADASRQLAYASGDSW